MIRACAHAPFFRSALIALIITAAEIVGGNADLSGGARLVVGAVLTACASISLGMIGDYREEVARRRGYVDGRADERSDAQGWGCRRA